jgi:hypothetical protein
MEDPKDNYDVAVPPLRKQVNEQAYLWYDAMQTEDFKTAASIAVLALREVLRLDVQNASRSFKDFVFGSRIVLNGLLDVAEVCVIASHEGWVEHPKVVEEVWMSIHDGKDRLTGYSGVDSEFVTYCLGMIEPAFIAIQERYGHGIYNSWELTLDGLNCSICDADIRGCEHVAGDWYDGQCCECEPIGGYISAVAIVQNPRDARCRIWPWHATAGSPAGKTHFVSPIFMIFTPEGAEECRDAVDPATLFS